MKLWKLFCKREFNEINLKMLIDMLIHITFDAIIDIMNNWSNKGFETVTVDEN